jgi:hypothetical protein
MILVVWQRPGRFRRRLQKEKKDAGTGGQKQAI